MATGALSAQNSVDSQGRKTGAWKAEYPDGQKRYEGTFREGKPMGTMTRYYKNGNKQALLEYPPQGNRVDATLFHENGRQAAVGIYLGREKDSLWSYYSSTDETLRMTEYYVDGKLHGLSQRYYPEGKLSEEVHWSAGLKEGPWKQFFGDGSIRLQANFQNDLLEGEYRVYYRTDLLMMEGLFLKDRSEGIWNYYDEEGELLYSLEYRNGRPVDGEEYRKLMEENMIPADTISRPGETEPMF